MYANSRSIIFNKSILMEYLVCWIYLTFKILSFDISLNHQYKFIFFLSIVLYLAHVIHTFVSSPLTMIEPVCKSPCTKHSFLFRKMPFMEFAASKTRGLSYSWGRLQLMSSDSLLVLSDLSKGLVKINCSVRETSSVFLKKNANLNW